MKTMYLKNFTSLCVVVAILFMAIAAPAMAADKVVVDFFNGVTTKQDASIAAVSPGTMTRSFSTATVAPGATIIVTITPAPASSPFSFYLVNETIPAGFTVTANTADAGTYVGNVWTFINLGSHSFTYTLTAPAAAGTYTFSGTFIDENRDTGIVSGPSIVTITSGNLIKNPGFESGKSKWIFYTDGTGIFRTISPGFEGSNAAHVTLTSGGSNIQLYQTGVTLKPNTNYRLSFAAKSSSARDLKVVLLKHGSPYTNYGLDKRFDLTANWQTFSTEFNTTGFADMVNDGRLMFYLAPYAKTRDNYYFDSVKLEEIQ